MHGHTVITAELGLHIAALTCHINGRPTAVINQAVSHNRQLKSQAAYALIGVGMDAGLALGALHGIRR